MTEGSRATTRPWVPWAFLLFGPLALPAPAPPLAGLVPGLVAAPPSPATAEGRPLPLDGSTVGIGSDPPPPLLGDGDGVGEAAGQDGGRRHRQRGRHGQGPARPAGPGGLAGSGGPAGSPAAVARFVQAPIGAQGGVR